MDVGNVVNSTDIGGWGNKVIINPTVNHIVHREGDVRLNVVDVTLVNPTTVDVNVDVRCYVTEGGTCSRHNIQLTKKKTRVRFWGESRVGNVRWKYRLEDSWI